MNTIVIDHHITNSKFGKINLVEPLYSSTCQIIYELFNLWGVKIDLDIALYLFIGIFGDTGGFKYQNTTPEVLKAAYELAKINPNYHKFIFEYENSMTPNEFEAMRLAFNSVETHLSDRIIFSTLSYDKIKKKGLNKSDAIEGMIADKLITVIGWDLAASLVELEPGIVRVSLRTRNQDKYDVSVIAKSIGKGGGGHKGASGTTIYAPLETAKKSLLKLISELYPDL